MADAPTDPPINPNEPDPGPPPEPPTSARPLDTAPEPILQFFAYDHLTERQQLVSRPFGELAHALVAVLPRNPERTVALRKLLESKDAAARASLMK